MACVGFESASRASPSIVTAGAGLLLARELNPSTEVEE